MLGGIVLLWVAFLRPEWNERALFCGAVVLTADLLLAGVPNYVFQSAFHHSYGNEWALFGTAAYLPALLIALTSKNVKLSLLFGAALCLCFVLPLAMGHANLYDTGGGGVLDVVGSGLLGVALVSLGFGVAEKAGAQIFYAEADAA